MKAILDRFYRMNEYYGREPGPCLWKGKKDGMVKKLDMTAEHDRRLLLDTYKFSNPFSTMAMKKNYGLL